MAGSSRLANRSTRHAGRWWGILLAICAVAVAAPQYRDSQSWAERDQWARPAEVLDALQVRPGSVVADVGAGEGYFTAHLAERVGARGKVYAVDVDERAVANLRKLAEERGFRQVEAVAGEPDDPRLPEGKLDAILVVNAYHEFRQHDAMLKAFLRALKPGGRVGIIDKAAEGGSRESNEQQHRLPQKFAREDLQRAGFTAVHDEKGFEPTGRRAGERWWFLAAEK